MRFRRRRDVACRQAVDLMTEYLDGALSPRDRERFEAHLAECDHCVEYLAQIRATIAMAGQFEPDDLPDEVIDELVGLYRSWRAD
jgi:anti-sigma factor (TIGR02949 family)